MGIRRVRKKVVPVIGKYVKKALMRYRIYPMEADYFKPWINHRNKLVENLHEAEKILIFININSMCRLGWGDKNGSTFSEEGRKNAGMCEIYINSRA